MSDFKVTNQVGLSCIFFTWIHTQDYNHVFTRVYFLEVVCTFFIYIHAYIYTGYTGTMYKGPLLRVYVLEERRPICKLNWKASICETHMQFFSISKCFQEYFFFKCFQVLTKSSEKLTPQTLLQIFSETLSEQITWIQFSFRCLTKNIFFSNLNI